MSMASAKTSPSRPPLAAPPREPAPLRPGYTGYLVAIGKVQD